MKKWIIFILLVLVVAVFLVIKPKQAQVTEQELSLPEEEYLAFIDKNMVSGGPPKDGIPAIDKPRYVTAEEAELAPDDLVFGIDYKGVVKAYPQNILYWHEIVNEEIGGEPVSITYCPLTGSVMGYLGKNLGVSGNLYNSNLVLYDRATDSEFPQILGKAVNGAIKGEELQRFHVYVTTWELWKQKYPETLVLSKETGFGRDYDRNPYPGYEGALRVWFPLAAESDLFQSKKIVSTLSNNKQYLAIPKEEFKSVKEKTVNVGGDAIKLQYDSELDVIKAFKGNERLTVTDMFWFAWYAYHPDTKVLEV